MTVEGTVNIPVTPTIRRRLKNKVIEMAARNYSETIGRLMDGWEAGGRKEVME